MGKRFSAERLRLDYFDLSQYLLQDYFSYTDSKETTVSGIPTWLHLLISAEENLRGIKVEKETDALRLTENGEISSYWGWNQYFLLTYGNEYESCIGTKVLTEKAGGWE